MQSSTFLVDNEPYCIWDSELKESCTRFLKGLDPDYFQYAFSAHLETEDEKRASVALRLSLHHGLETFFSLVGAFVQAPDCPFAWLSKCSTAALRSVVERIGKGDKELFTKLNVSEPSWPEIARVVHCTYMPGTVRQAEAVDGFTELWQRMAHEFLTTEHIDEYNSIKHGFRVANGGFGIAVAVESSPGVEPAPEAFKELGKSDFGSSFFRIEPLSATKGERSLVLAEQSVNWSLERIVLLNQATYMSINNIVSALRIVNDFAASDCKFLRPEDSKNFLSAWDYSPGVRSMTWRRNTNPTIARTLTRIEILKALNRSTDA
jgi:hypothetical protein